MTPEEMEAAIKALQADVASLKAAAAEAELEQQRAREWRRRSSAGTTDPKEPRGSQRG